MTHIRGWLSRNKIFFETIAATLLSVMAITLTVVQICISQQQTRVLELQTKIAENQWERDVRRVTLEKSAQWQRLRDGIWRIFDILPPGGFHLLENLPPEQRGAWFQQIRTLLDAQTDNPVLLENRACLGSWRNAISNAKITAELFETTDMTTLPNWATIKAESVLRDVMFVWKELVLRSDEVSATGGRPPEAER